MERDEHIKPDLRQHRRRANRWLPVVLSSVAFAAAILRAFPPGVNAFYPSCPFYQATGLLCPGCGATRALAALARGQFAQALQYNAFVVVALPIALTFAANAYLSAMRGQRAWPAVPRFVIAGALASTVAFAVLRNLP